MKNLTRTLLTSLILITELLVHAQQSPLMQRTASAAADKIYDTKQWSFDSYAPIRATPLASGNSVYFGNARGIFFALDKKTGSLKWKYETGHAIHSSAIEANGKIIFTDNAQTLYALNASDGKLIWKLSFGKKLTYLWRFDYYYSSPIVYEDRILVGGDDGFLHCVGLNSGKEIWKFAAGGVIRTTVSIDNGIAYFGDTNGKLYSIDAKSGTKKWSFSTMGDTLKSSDYGFDRNAILSSPVVYQSFIIFGSRDGYLYCIDKEGKLKWTSNHNFSWVISTVAVVDNIVVTGTSDGHFVQAVDLTSGKELWRYKGSTLFWSSPLVMNGKIYIGGYDGQLYCLDLKSGKRISQFESGATMLSSPVFNDGLVYVGSDDGKVYALKGRDEKEITPSENLQKFAFYEPGVNVYYKNGSDVMVKSYLANFNYKILGEDSLNAMLNRSEAKNSVLVFATDYFPNSIISDRENSLLRKYLDNGGKVILTGMNPIVYKIGGEAKSPYAFNVPAADTVLGLKYGENDTRSFGGIIPSFPTESGKEFGLADYWVSMLFIAQDKVDKVLGKSENGEVSAFIKNYKNGGRLIQIFIDPDKPSNLDSILKLSDAALN
ncbi:MAG: hypothetical protein C5B52_06345 [Bacteroidetes bacterium]|nr:MAG: hypothetical protein C5B52_06345 [Bacteroidota bacterium]